jgi:hypothetical protein
LPVLVFAPDSGAAPELAETPHAIEHRSPAQASAPAPREPTVGCDGAPAREASPARVTIASDPERLPTAATEPAAPATPAGQTDTGAGPTAAPEPAGEALDQAAAAHAPSAPASANEPAPDFGRAAVTQPLIATDPEVTDPVYELAPPPSRDSVLLPIAGPTGDVAGVLAPLRIGPAAADLARWDAPPPASSATAGGWAAPPTPVRSGRFQRPGRLVAASLAQPSSAA